MVFKKNSSFRIGFYHLKMALEYFLDFKRENPNTHGGKAAKVIANKIQWCFDDFKSNPNFPKSTQNIFSLEMEQEVLLTDSISRMSLELDLKGKESLEKILEALLNKEKLTIILNDNT